MCVHVCVVSASKCLAVLNIHLTLLLLLLLLDSQSGSSLPSFLPELPVSLHPLLLLLSPFLAHTVFVSLFLLSSLSAFSLSLSLSHLPFFPFSSTTFSLSFCFLSFVFFLSRFLCGVSAYLQSTEAGLCFHAVPKSNKDAYKFLRHDESFLFSFLRVSVQLFIMLCGYNFVHCHYF